MTLELAAPDLLTAAQTQPWHYPERYWPTLTEATADRSAPVVALGIEALAYNAHDLLRRAGGLPIRIASKSIRVRGVLDAVLALPGYHGVLAYTLAEAVWLSETIDDIVVGYPSADRAAIAALAADERAASRVAVMVDSVAQLDLIDAVVAPGKRPPIRVCLDFDASWRTRMLGHIGVLRSPVHTVEALRALAEAVLDRPGFELVGIMAYEAQIAGEGDQPIGKPLAGAVMRAVQRASGAELLERRAQAVAAVRRIADLAFVNGGGTGSVERSATDPSLTEVAAGSGLFGPHLFDNYRAFTPAPAVAFALDVVRRPNPETATLLGGGWVASGPVDDNVLPHTVWPEGLRYAKLEGAGEVQTPVIGRAAAGLSIGDRVWLRHTKSGEPMEHANEVIPVRVGAAPGSLTAPGSPAAPEPVTTPEPPEGPSAPAATDPLSAPAATDPLPTYRGEGQCFL